MIDQLDDFVCDIQCEEYYAYLEAEEELMNDEDEAEVY